MTPIDLGSYKSIYLKTAKEYVDKMSVSLDQLSSDISNKDVLNNLHIASHSLKSQSQVMGYDGIANICLNIEAISNDALRGEKPLTNKVIADIKSSVEEIKKMLKPHFAEASRGQANSA